MVWAYVMNQNYWSFQMIFHPLQQNASGKWGVYIYMPGSSRYVKFLPFGRFFGVNLGTNFKHKRKIQVCIAGQIIATSHDLTPNGGLVREISLFQGNLGWWNIRDTPVARDARVTDAAVQGWWNIIIWEDSFTCPKISRIFCLGRYVTSSSWSWGSQPPGRSSLRPQGS